MKIHIYFVNACYSLYCVQFMHSCVHHLFIYFFDLIMFNQNDFFLVSNTGLLQSFSLIKSNNLFHSDVQKTNAMSANATKPKMTKVHL